jgi:flagellar biosynthetic protein FliP
VAPAVVTGAVLAVLAVLAGGTAWAADAVPIPQISLGVGQATSPSGVAQSLQILFLLTVLSLAPSILILMTSFTRILIVLSFTRSALATQQMPPNQVLIGLALFLTLFVMWPTWQNVNSTALQPYLAGRMPAEQALQVGMKPVREFMLRQTREKDLALFVEMSRTPRPRAPADVPTQVVIPAFIISELKTAFQIGFMIFVPFLVIDMIVASTLMSMGMLMLPPVMVSLPFKILLFVLVDGWYLVVRSLLLSFR